MGVPYVITQPLHCSAAGIITVAIRWPHVRGYLLNEIADRHLIIDHFLFPPGFAEEREVRMGPGVGGNLMPL